jgi:hypothetical protein
VQTPSPIGFAIDLQLRHIFLIRVSDPSGISIPVNSQILDI